MSSEEVNIDTDESYSRLVLLLCVVLGIWLVAGVLILVLSSCGYLENLGQIGDSFGALNTLFSGLAFAVLIYTIHQQKQELRLQRLELEQTRNELRGQKEQLALQNQTFIAQQFDSTFFQSVDLHHRIVGEITVGAAIGRRALKHLGNGVRNEVKIPGASPGAFDKTSANLIEPLAIHTTSRSANQAEASFGVSDPQRMNKPLFLLTPEERQKHASDEYMKTYCDFQHALGHYFRNLYRILKFIDESSVSNKRTYSGLLRAQLSYPELVLIFFNCLSPNGRSKFKPLVEKYALLEHIPKDEPFMTTFGALYKASAFGEPGEG